LVKENSWKKLKEQHDFTDGNIKKFAEAQNVHPINRARETRL
jgi:hypothetical protein